MYNLIRKYFENTNEEEEIVLSSENKNELVDKFEEELEKDEKFGYVVDDEQNEYDNVRLFLGEQENWNNYIEMYIKEIKDDKEEILKDRLNNLAKNYENMDYSDFTGCLLAMETEYDIHFQKLFNQVAQMIIERRIKNFSGKRTIDNEDFRTFIMELEKEFECDIDLFDLSISPKIL